MKSENNLCLTDLVGDHIYDKVVEGFERQLISPNDFFSTLEQKGVCKLSSKEKDIIWKVFKLMNVGTNWFSVSKIAQTLESYYIRDHMPEDNKYFKFSTLAGKDIRMINLLIAHLSNNHITIRDFLEDIIYTHEIEDPSNPAGK